MKINQVSDPRLEAAQGNKIDFTGFLQCGTVEVSYNTSEKVDTKAKDCVFSLLRVPIFPDLMDWQLYDLQIHLPGSRSMTPLPARFRTLNTVGSELVRMKK